MQIRSTYLFIAVWLCALTVTTVSSLATEQQVQLRDEHVLRRLIHVPTTRQSTEYTCGVAALQSIFAYYGDDVRENLLARQLKANAKNGTNYHKIAKLARTKGYTVNVYTNTTLVRLKKFLDARQPMICLIQAWTGHQVDFANDWNDGHYVVAIGYDKDKLYFMDPSTLGNYTYIPTEEFLVRWHDCDEKEKLVHWAMEIYKPGPTFNPNLIKPLH